MHTSSAAAKVALFDAFTPAQRERLTDAMVRRRVMRGEHLYAAGDEADALYVVCHGRIRLEWDDSRPATLIGAGEMLGEAAFLGHGAHDHAATARRDAEVLVLTRRNYERVLQHDSELAAGFLRLAMRRLQALSASAAAPDADEKPATLAVIPLPGQNIPPELFTRLRRILEQQDAVVVDRDDITGRFGGLTCDDAGIVAWLNTLERSGGKVVLVADATASDWTERCVRQADRVLLVGQGPAPTGDASAIERLVASLHPAAARRLVLVHPRRQGVVSGTRAWLDRIEVDLHHHVSLEDDVDLESLGRFMTDRAIGFVAGGGGGLGAAHIGIYKAFREAGVTFDIFVGTSVGAAMLAGFSFLYEAEGLTAGTHDIFVASRSFKRPTWPRYGLLDHTAFDAALKRAYGAETLIEDCWRPFRAVATNLTTRRLELIGSGPLWKAVRASSSIPCVLPPVVTADGTVYVDGGVMDDVPLQPMKGLKAGPNIVVHFGKAGEQRMVCDYDAIPGRGRLIAGLLNPFARLPKAPRPLGMLFRTMLAHQRYELPAGPADLILTPPAPRGASVLNFDNHMAVSEAAYRWAYRRIDAPPAAWAGALSAILPAPPDDETELARLVA